jgi:DNA-binding transcriptional LysR family regulator
MSRSWDLYRTFLAVVEEGSLSGAARQLGLTQPTIARHIDALEAAVGYDLFLRSQRGLIASEAALELKPYAETLAATSAALLRAASGHAQTKDGGVVKGTVRITASEVVGAEHLPPILARLRQRHPQLVVELVLSNEVSDLLRRDADIAVRMVEPVQDSLVAKRLPGIGVGLHARRDYLDRRGTPASMADLAGHDLIGYDRETPALRPFLRLYPALNRPALALRTDSDLAQLAAIRAGFGIGACQIAVAARNPDLVRVLASEFEIELGMWIVMHEDLKTSPRCRAVFDALVESMDGKLDNSGRLAAGSHASTGDSHSAKITPM